MFVAWLAAATSPVVLPPVEQCPNDAGFGEFRAALSDVLERRDMDALLDLMADDVRVSFGGRFGKTQFREYWRRSSVGSEDIWAELREVLSLGCAVRGKSRVFPSMFVQANDLDGFTTWVARPGARLRSRPSLKAPIRAHLSWDVLTEEDDEGGDWLSVVTARGKRGFIHRTAARSLIDYRLFVQPIGGAWRITAFVAGD